MSLTTQRDERIDLLRFIGLAMVVLAHVYPPFIVAQLRNFDVPLMVLVSALSFSASVKQESYGQYVWARVKRLVFPVWLFLALYFAMQWAFAFPVALPSAREPLLVPLVCIDGIGYVWVIRIFLLVALIGPFRLPFPSTRKQSSQIFWRPRVGVCAIPSNGLVGVTAFERCAESDFSEYAVLCFTLWGGFCVWFACPRQC